MPISVLPAPQILTALVQYGYPALRGLEKAKTGESLTDKDYVHFTIYFVICALVMLLEETVLWVLVDYFPLFLEAKLLFFLWLMHPDYEGATYLWAKHAPLYKQIDDKYYEKVMNAVQAEGIELPKTKVEEVDVSDKNEVIKEMLAKSAEKKAD
eukprot:TRINITY_DN97164_c0_g1_i1.p1 TRINITY_DN97164_c0_g1~~TRINITY_DN97164_c0_g1_i1.p1  ORF type:complete len:154 (-),score=39.83 TRINITY_DN97164_c0_g1_i1:71-532(-)